jgi:hypothetical protein
VPASRASLGAHVAQPPRPRRGSKRHRGKTTGEVSEPSTSNDSAEGKEAPPA